MISGFFADLVPAYSAGPTLRIYTVFPFHRALTGTAPGRRDFVPLSVNNPKENVKRRIGRNKHLGGGFVPDKVDRFVRALQGGICWV
jgi:hypothetical protein